MAEAGGTTTGTYAVHANLGRFVSRDPWGMSSARIEAIRFHCRLPVAWLRECSERCITSGLHRPDGEDKSSGTSFRWVSYSPVIFPVVCSEGRSQCSFAVWDACGRVICGLARAICRGVLDVRWKRMSYSRQSISCGHFSPAKWLEVETGKSFLEADGGKLYFGSSHVEEWNLHQKQCSLR